MERASSASCWDGVPRCAHVELGGRTTTGYPSLGRGDVSTVGRHPLSLFDHPDPEETPGSLGAELEESVVVSLVLHRTHVVPEGGEEGTALAEGPERRP